MSIMLEGTHRNANLENPKTYVAYLDEGQALMFDVRLRIQDPKTGGGVVFAMLCDMNARSSPDSLYMY